MKYVFKKIEEDDLDRIVEIYNSNEKFLTNHIGLSKIDKDWVGNELLETKKAGFISHKILDLKSSSVIGFIDFIIGDEVYISLLMLDSEYSGHGIGRVVYNLFENNICTNSNSIRIDVVSDYNNYILKFWEKLGFVYDDNIKIKWNNKVLDALLMRKELIQCAMPINNCI